jgi:hypothetical protein
MNFQTSDYMDYKLSNLYQALETEGKSGDWVEINKSAPQVNRIMEGVTYYIKELWVLHWA